MADILNSAILNLDILDSAILVFHLKFTHTCQDWLPPFAHKRTSLIHSDSTWWLQPSCILLCWIQPFWTPKTSLIYFHSTWWWQPSSLQPSWIQPFWTKKLHSFILTHLDDGIHLEFFHVWFIPLPSWIQTPCYLVSDSLKETLTPLWAWLKLIQSDLNSFILSYLDDCSHLEFCHLGFNHFEHQKLPH